MDEFKLLTQGVSLNRGEVSRGLHFNSRQVNEPKDYHTKLFSRLNFFGEQKDTDVRELSVVQNTVSHKTKDVLLNEDNDSGEDWFYSPEEIRLYRKKHKIYVARCGETTSHVISREDDDIAPLRSFDQLSDYFNVDYWIVQNVKKLLHYKTPTAIQKQAIPCILSGQSLLATAPTGSGKTIAFLLPLLVFLKAPSKDFLRSLIIVPSRELAIQTIRVFNVLQGHKKFRCRLLEQKVGSSNPQNEWRRLDVGVSTPLKLICFLKHGQVTLDALKILVLDEADRLLDLGFSPQLDEILSYISFKTVQVLFFSATLSHDVSTLVNSCVFNALRISVGTPMTAPSEINQRLVFVTHEEGKLSTFRQFIRDNTIQLPALVFMQTIERATQLFIELVYDGIFVDVIHADRSKKDRDAVIRAFREKKIWVLICTDVMARGVDFKDVKTVINWDVPQSSASYVHRIGRTGRAGQRGTAVTFFTVDDMTYLRPIVNVVKQSGGVVPDWMLRVKKLDHRRRLDSSVKVSEWLPKNSVNDSSSGSLEILRGMYAIHNQTYNVQKLGERLDYVDAIICI